MKDYKRLGDYIREVDERNRELSVTKQRELVVINTFIHSTARLEK